MSNTDNRNQIAIPIHNGCFYVMNETEYIHAGWMDAQHTNDYTRIPMGLKAAALKRGKGYKRTKESYDSKGGRLHGTRTDWAR